MNQSDLDEKDAQVLLIKKIFENASKVIAWLSPPRKDPDLVAAFLNHFNDYLVNNIKKSSTLLPSLRSAAIAKLNSPGGKALRNVLCHPYFTRIWIFEEIIMAKKFIVVYGHRHLNWNALVNVTYLTKYPVFSDLLMVVPGENMYDPDMFGLPPGCEAIYQMEESRQARIKYLVEGKEPSDALMTMETNIIWCARRAATRPHDKIYALIGISKDIVQYLNLRPKYKDPTEKVFTDWTESIFYQRKSLQLLSIAGIGYPRQCSSLPSFVPDLSCPPKAWSLWHPEEAKKFRAGAHYKACMDIHASGEGAITIRGFPLGQVVQVSPVLEEAIFVSSFSAAKDSPRALHKWLEDAESLAMKLGMDPYLTGDLHNAFWRTLIGNRDMVDEAAPPYYLFHYLLMRYSLARELGLAKEEISGFERVKKEYDPAGDRQYFDRGGEHANVAFKFLLARTATHRRFGVVNFGRPDPQKPNAASENCGLLALVPPGTQSGVEGAGTEENPEGDWIYLFEGAETPFVVRVDRTDKGVTRSPTCYIVGECYVHGAMDGKIMESVNTDRSPVTSDDLFVR
jgi:hypothetical protein